MQDTCVLRICYRGSFFKVVLLSLNMFHCLLQSYRSKQVKVNDKTWICVFYLILLLLAG